MAAITLEGLKKTHGAKANSLYREIAKAGGFGVANGFPVNAPDLDIGGLQGDEKKAVETILKNAKGSK